MKLRNGLGHMRWSQGGRVPSCLSLVVFMTFVGCATRHRSSRPAILWDQTLIEASLDGHIDTQERQRILDSRTRVFAKRKWAPSTDEGISAEAVSHELGPPRLTFEVAGFAVPDKAPSETEATVRAVIAGQGCSAKNGTVHLWVWHTSCERICPPVAFCYWIVSDDGARFVGHGSFWVDWDEWPTSGLPDGLGSQYQMGKAVKWEWTSKDNAAGFAYWPGPMVAFPPMSRVPEPFAIVMRDVVESRYPKAPITGAACDVPWTTP